MQGRTTEFLRGGGRGRRGILLYIAISFLALLSVLASALIYVSTEEEMAAVMVYESEVINNLAEAAVEEALYNFREELNNPSDKIFQELRQPVVGEAGKAIAISPDYMKHVTVQARKLASELYNIPEKRFLVEAKITDIRPFEIRGVRPDPMEKNASLKIKVTVTYGKITKVVIVSRPIKVVRCTIPVLSECTLFVNNYEVEHYAQWPSVYGYRVGGYPKPQQSLVLDHGWAAYSEKNTKQDFIRIFETEILPKGTVPPGRVFINRGIVPLTNGNRTSGMLQKAFYSAETELLPQQMNLPLKKLKEALKRQEEGENGAGNGEERREDGSSEHDAAPGGANEEGSEDSEREGAGGGGTGEEAASGEGERGRLADSESIPEDGELIFRYVGHGLELMKDDLAEYMGGQKISGYEVYFKSYIDSDWSRSSERQPVRSGLDLFGRVEEKVEGETTKVGGGFWQKIIGFVKKITAKLMKKLYKKYHIRISPTLVYGQVFQTYFLVRDYVETGWLEKMKNQFTFNPNQRPLPYFPEGYLDRFDPDKPLELGDLPAEWDDRTKKLFSKLPEMIRKPRFFKTIDTTVLSKVNYGVDPQFQAVLKNLPRGTLWAPYNDCLLEFLMPPMDSPLRRYFVALKQMNPPVYFMSNELDKAIEQVNGAFEDEYDGPLRDFNPFLFYVKATDYISSVYDPRDPRVNVFYKKYLDKRKGVLNLNGVIYITGTEPLVLGNIRYHGKAIIITFGRVIFTGPFVKSTDSAEDPRKNDLLTIVSLGGIEFRTSERVDAMLYSYIFPFEVKDGNKLNVFGGMGCNNLDLSLIPEGGNVNFDWTYHIPPDMEMEDRSVYYYAAITDEIARYEYFVRRAGLLGGISGTEGGGGGGER